MLACLTPSERNNTSDWLTSVDVITTSVSSINRKLFPDGSRIQMIHSDNSAGLRISSMAMVSSADIFSFTADMFMGGSDSKKTNRDWTMAVFPAHHPNGDTGGIPPLWI